MIYLKEKEKTHQKFCLKIKEYTYLFLKIDTRSISVKEIYLGLIKKKDTQDKGNSLN